MSKFLNSNKTNLPDVTYIAIEDICCFKVDFYKL